MATNYDILFLRQMLEDRLTDRAQALRCLQVIEGEAQRGRALNAALAVVELGLLERPQAQRVHQLISQQFEQSGRQVVRVDPELARRHLGGTQPEEPQLELPADEEPPARQAEGAPRYYDLAQSGGGLEGYELGPLIAHGTAGSSYRGRRKDDGAEVVIKTLHRRFQDHPALLGEVSREVLGWVDFRHPNVAATLAIGASHSHTVVVFERAPGETLEALLDRRGGLPVTEVLAIVEDLAEALAAAHAQGLAVGDLRARKVYFDGERARLTDLGLSRASCIAAGFGQYGLSCGHPSYLAPEVLQEGIRQPTPGADVYALGVLFYELLCGCTPFHGSVPEVLEQHLEAALPPPPDGVTFSTSVAGLILRMTAKRVEQRVNDAGQLAQALRSLQDGKPFRLLSGTHERLPGDAGPDLSERDWGEATAEAARQSSTQRWSETRIHEAAAHVGSFADFLVEAPGSGGAPSARLPAELVARIRALDPDASSATREGDAALDAMVPGDLTADLDDADRADARSGPGSAASGSAARVATASGTPARVPSPSAPSPSAPLGSGLSASAPPAQRPGVKLGDRLGRGPMGTTYEGSAPELEVPVVVKVISRKFAKHEGLFERVLDTIRAARGFDHPHVVPVLDVSSAAGRDLVISERVEGPTLRAVLQERGPRPLREAIAFVTDLAAALEAAEERGLHHGDIRPEKVFVDRGSIARLADFGQAEGSCLAAGFARIGLRFGHPDYLAPEVLQEQRTEPDAKGDLYALGILFYELLCGVAPFHAEDPRQTLVGHLNRPLPKPKGVSLPPPVADVLIRLTAKDPRKRYESASALRRDLREALETSAGASGAEQPAAALMVEEFDPLASQENISPEVWGLTSQVVNQPNEVWSKERLKEAQRTGPASWRSDAAKATTAGQLYADLEKKLGGGKRKAKDPAANRQMMLSAGGLVSLLLLVGLAWVATRSDEAPKPAPPKPVISDAGTDRGPTEPAGDGAGPSPGARDARQADVEQALQRYEQDVRSRLGGEQYQAALELDERIDEALRDDPTVRRRVDELELEVYQAVAQRLQRESEAIDQLIRLRDLDRATRQVAAMRAWVVDPEALKPLEERLRRLQDELVGDVAALKLPQDIAQRYDPAGARRALSGRLRGWSSGGRLFEGGGMLLRYPNGEDALAADLLCLRGEPPRPAMTPAGGLRGLHVKAGPTTPTILALNVPFERVLRASVGVVVAGRPSADAQVALIAGASERQHHGLGTSWGVLPVRLGPTGTRPLLTLPFPQVPLRAPLELRFQAPAGMGAGRGALRGALVDRGTMSVLETERPVPVPLAELRGLLLIYVLDAEVWITSLEVGGLVDPGALR